MGINKLYDQLVEAQAWMQREEHNGSVAHDPVYSTLYGRAAQEIERLTRMVRHASDQGVTFPPDTLPRVAGAETIVVCPVCKTAWAFDSHDNCPTCELPPQGMN